MLTPELKTKARLITLGALWGFLSGALVVSLVVWQARPSQTWLGSGARFVAAKLDAVDRWDRGHVDDDAPVLEAGEVGTAGTSDGPKPTPTVGAPPDKELEDRDLVIPVEGVGAGDLVRSFEDARGARKHEALDIIAPMDTPVRAVEGGRIARLFNSKAGGITVYQFDPTERYCYYYAHLSRYADGLRENDRVSRGQVIGFVGTSGNAPKDTPHLHFAIFRLTDEKRWWEGTPLDPYDILR
jgi:murein DD-endopeptidase MepM/ murein hydrolase activator NlpD